jgi:clan AA aspartic protease (TIGR02281 family)
MLIDTGADTVVLPASMITPLGLNPAALSQREVQTANGRVQARIGTLDGLWLDGVRLASIEVAFLESDKLGTGGLLGMSVLGRYQMTIDDEKNRLTLTPAGAARDREAAAESAPATPAETSSEPVTQ